MLSEKWISWMSFWIVVCIKFIPQQIREAFSEFNPFIQYFITNILCVGLSLLFVKLKLAIVDKKTRSYDSIHLGIVVTQNNLLQIHIASFPIGKIVLSVDDIGDTFISFPVVGLKHDLSYPFDINIEEVRFWFIILMTEVGHIDNHYLLLFVFIVYYCFLTQWRSLCIFSFIECGHLTTHIAHSKVQ